MPSVPAEEHAFRLNQRISAEDDFRNLVGFGAIQDAPLTADEARAILNFFGT
jgi:hypothetical protein